MKKRPVKLEGALIERDPATYNPLSNYTVKLTSETLASMGELLRPKEIEIKEMLDKLMKRKQWTIAMAASILNINGSAVSKIRKEGGRGAAARLIWLLTKLDEEPEFLTSPLYYHSWGKSKGLVPKKEPVPHPFRTKQRTPNILRPTSPWLYVDWSMPRAEIAKLVNVTESTVAINFRRLRKTPKSRLWRAFAAVGRGRQAGNIIRGISQMSSAQMAAGLTERIEQSKKEAFGQHGMAAR